MLNIPLPGQKLQELRAVSGLTDEVLGGIAPYRDLLLAERQRFAEHLHEKFMVIPGTRVFLQHEHVPGQLKNIWVRWYETVLAQKSVQELMGYLWHVGLRHVEVNLEQSYANAGFTITRMFMHDILERNASRGDVFKGLRAVDGILDLCLLVETQAYIENLSRCDMDIMDGIADKVRNPVTIIGGNVRRLMRKPPGEPGLQDIYETIIDENTRLERMVRNIKKYIELFRHKPEMQRVDLPAVLDNAITRLRDDNGGLPLFQVERRFDPGAVFALGSPGELEDMFYYLIMDCIEDPGFLGDPLRVETSSDDTPSRNIQVIFSCPGSTMRPADPEKLFQPFSSKSSLGTGFGLPTAMLAVRKNHGNFRIEPWPEGDGARFIITLPSSD